MVHAQMRYIKKEIHILSIHLIYVCLYGRFNVDSNIGFKILIQNMVYEKGNVITQILY